MEKLLELEATKRLPETVRDRVLRVGVVGLGRSGTFFHCRPMSESQKFRLEGVWDVRPHVALEVGRKYGCATFASLDDMLCSAADLVVLAVPTRDHLTLAMKVLSSGKALLVEKPFAATSAEAEEIFAAANRGGVPVYAYHNRRFDPDVRALANILDSGVLGEVVKVSVNLHSYQRRRDWQTLRAMGGGALSNWGAHAIDWCFHLFGSGLTLDWARLYQVLNPGDAEDSFVLALSQGRMCIHIEYLNCAARPLPKWHVVGRLGTAISEGKTFHLRYCDQRMMVPVAADHSSASDGTYGIKEDLGWREEVCEWGHWDNCVPFLDFLHAHILTGAPPPIEKADVLAQLRLMEDIRAKAEVSRFPTAAL